MAAPTLWKGLFPVNAGFTAGTQTVPQTIGLANGNILVVWEDTVQGGSQFPGIDVVGRLLDPEGVPLGPVFQVNLTSTEGNETGPKIVALPDGGFVMAYGGFNNTEGGFIAVDRYNSSLQPVSSQHINDPRSSLTKWEITADSAGNYTVAYERLSDHPLPFGGTIASIDVFSLTYDAVTNIPGPERPAGPDGADTDHLGAIASFANGHMVTFTRDPDSDIFGNDAEIARFLITNPLTGEILRGPTEVAGTISLLDDITDAIPKDVAVLKNGQFVMLYTQLVDFDVSLWMRVGSSETGAIGPAIRIFYDANFHGDYQAHVVALEDGDFFVTWSPNAPDVNSEVPLWGQRFNPDGSTDGFRTIYNLDVAQAGFGDSHMSLTGDGRILLPYRDKNGEIVLQILDPRPPGDIHGDGTDEAITARLDSTKIFGEGGNDTLYGQGGNDELYGGPGFDILDGGPGNDFYILQDRALQPAGSFFILDYDRVIEKPNEGTDTVLVQPLSGFGTSYTLPANVENGIVLAAGGFTLSGNELPNRLTGNAEDNQLNGFAGDDILDGGSGANVLDGGPDTDTAAYGFASAQANWLHNLDGTWTVTGPGRTDTLSNMERLQFTDRTVALSSPRNDVNADGRSDLLWRHNTTGVVAEWDMNDRTVLSTGVIGGDANWSIVGTGDFNRDGRSDILWRHNTTGVVAEWDMNDRSVLSSGVIGGDANWSVVGTGDFNADSRSDILWRHNTTGVVAEWDMNDRTVLSSGVIGGDANWHLALLL